MIDLIVPCFNEADRWNPDYWKRMMSLPDIRWTFVDDGSKDETGARLAETASHGPAGILTLPRNSGKAEAVRQGMLTALQGRTRAVGFMDSDGAFNPDDVTDMTQSFQRHVIHDQGFDAVWSSRVALAGRNIDRRASRHYVGRVVATVLSLGEERIPYDTQSGLKFFAPSNQLRGVLEKPFRTRWLFEIELLVRWRQQLGVPLRVWEEPLNYWHDVPGSKIRGSEMVRIAREVVLVKREQGKVR